METIINIYCDESCHLPNDGQKAMVLGTLWSDKVEASTYNQEIEIGVLLQNIKTKYH